MVKSYSILILPENETKVKRLGISHHTMRVVLGVAVFVAGVSAWMLGDYLWMKFQRHRETGARAQLTAEVETLKTRSHKEVTLLRNQVLRQQEKLLTLQEQVETSQQLLATWKDGRARFAGSLPKQQRTSLKGQHIVDNLEKSLGTLQGELQGLIASIPSEWPTTGWLSSGFGSRKSPLGGGIEFHTGLDIANRKGTPVHAPGDAVVQAAGTDSANGKHVVLNHGQGITTHFAHLSKIQVRQGERVHRDQQLGAIGSTGRSTNPHLHYEVRVNGIPVDPRKQLGSGNPPMS